MVCVDDFGERFRIRFLANVPVRGPGEPIKRQTGTGISHLGHALIRRISENGRQQDCLVLGWFIIMEMREAGGELSPAVHFCEEVRQLDPWQEIIGAFGPFFGGLRYGPGQGSEMKMAAFQTGLWQLAFSASEPTRSICS